MVCVCTVGDTLHGLQLARRKKEDFAASFAKKAHTMPRLASAANGGQHTNAPYAIETCHGIPMPLMP